MSRGPRLRLVTGMEGSAGLCSLPPMPANGHKHPTGGKGILSCRASFGLRAQVNSCVMNAQGIVAGLFPRSICTAVAAFGPGGSSDCHVFVDAVVPRSVLLSSRRLRALYPRIPRTSEDHLLPCYLCKFH